MVGFPHSEILGSKLIRSSPRLIAAYYVLHRLHAPRHPLDALKALDRSHYLYPQRPRPLLKGRLVIGQRTKDHVLATWSFDRSDQKKPEFTCCRCLSPRVWDQTSSEASLYDVERSGSVTSYKDMSSQTCSLTMRRLGYWGTGGAGRNRTDDILLAKQALSQLSYGPIPFPEEWWARVDSNYRPHAYQACALTT
jgi:hypothetical protein